MEGVKSLQHSFIIRQNIYFSSVNGTPCSLHYCAVLPAVTTSHSPVCQYHSTLYCTQNEKTVTIQLCQYQYPSSNNEWLVHNELEWMWEEVVTACLKNYCNICLKQQRKANENLSGYLMPWTSFTPGISI